MTTSDLISDENSCFLVLCSTHTAGIKNRNLEAGMIQILWYLKNISVAIQVTGWTALQQQNILGLFPVVPVGKVELKKAKQ